MFLAINPVAFSLFGWEVRWYGIIITLAAFLGIELANREAKKRGFPQDSLWDFAFWGLPFAFLGARLYYVLFKWDYYAVHLSEILAIHQGGIALYGGLIFGAIAALIYCIKNSYSFTLFVDILAPYFLLAQSIGRWGNFMNQEAHGDSIAKSALEAWHLPAFIIEQMRIDGVYYQPTFLYESLLSFIGVIIILTLRHYAPLRLGDAVSFYLVWYGSSRFLVEGMRTDSLYVFSTIRVSQALSLFFIALGILYAIYRYRHKEEYIYYKKLIHPMNLAVF